MKFTDRLMFDASGIRRTKDGYAVVDARVARAGNVQEYFGYELGEPDRETIRVYRPATEVFKRDAIATYAGVPVTVGHPNAQVTADSWKDLAVGETGEDVLRDGEFVRVPLMLRDSKAIKAVEDGIRELSMGYDAKITMADGISPSGEPFDAIMSDFRMNHVALVKFARGGSELRIGDGAGAKKWGASPVSVERNVNMELKKVLVDGLQVETTDAGAHAITKLLKDLETSAANIAQLTKAHETALAAKDAVIASKDKELATKDAALEDAKKKIVSDADLDKRVQARADLVNTAKAIAKDVKIEGLSDAAIRKAVVAAVLGDAAVKDKTETYIDARFDILVEDAAKAANDGGTGNDNNDAFRNVRRDAAVVTDVDKVRLEAEKRERDAWKGNKAA